MMGGSKEIPTRGGAVSHWGQRKDLSAAMADDLLGRSAELGGPCAQ